jgi:hypothetical protein
LNDIPSRESSLAADYDSDLPHHSPSLVPINGASVNWSKYAASSPTTTTTTTTTTNSETRPLLNRDIYSYYDNDDDNGDVETAVQHLYNRADDYDNDGDNDDNESGKGCCTAPAGPHSFACCECGCCGFCTQAAEYEHWVEGCRSAMPCHLPICACTNWLCSFSFGHRSTWCSRTCCGTLSLSLFQFLLCH